MMDVVEDGDHDDEVSLADEIKKERERFNNRQMGFSIVKTLNFMD